MREARLSARSLSLFDLGDRRLPAHANLDVSERFELLVKLPVGTRSFWRELVWPFYRRVSPVIRAAE